MLPSAARLNRSQDFHLVVRQGRRIGRSRLVVHAYVPTPGGFTLPRVGFVVSKAVGNSVVRHRVSRRLRHLVRARLNQLPRESAIVIRALPAAVAATSHELGHDLDSALRKLGWQTTIGGQP